MQTGVLCVCSSPEEVGEELLSRRKTVPFKYYLPGVLFGTPRVEVVLEHVLLKVLAPGIELFSVPLGPIHTRTMNLSPKRQNPVT